MTFKSNHCGLCHFEGKRTGSCEVHSVRHDTAFYDIGIKIIRAGGQKIEDVSEEKNEAFHGNDHGLD